MIPNASIPSVLRTGFQRTPATGIASTASRLRTPYTGGGSTRSGYTTLGILLTVVPTGSLLAFAVTAFALIVVPGPSVLFVISRGVALGGRAALATVFGNAAGAYSQVVVVALGLGALIERSAALFTAVKLVGAAYIVFLGVQAIRHRRKLSSVLEAATAPRGTRRILREGFVVGITNPKAAVFMAAVLPSSPTRPEATCRSNSSCSVSSSLPSPSSRTASGASPRDTRAPGSAGRRSGSRHSAGSAASS